MNRGVFVAAVAAVAVAAPGVASGRVYLGPSPYLSFADSPLAGGSYTAFYLENFESGALSVPGVSASFGVVAPPGVFTDSVDADDGSIDGSGAAGHSWYSGNSVTTMRFTFDAGVLGAYPTDAGIVWTDVGQSAQGLGFGDVYFEAFDAGGVSLGISGPFFLGDGTAISQTAEDRFFGATNAGGISAIQISMPASVDWEVDHLQFGIVPTPGAAALGLLAVGFMLRKRS